MPLTFPILANSLESFSKYMLKLEKLCYRGSILYSCIESSGADHRPYSAGTILTVLSGGEALRGEAPRT